MSCSSLSWYTTSRRRAPRLLRHRGGPVTAGGAVPDGGGERPEYLIGRSDRLKEVAGLTWRGLAGALAGERKQMLPWRRGTARRGGTQAAAGRP